MSLFKKNPLKDFSVRPPDIKTGQITGVQDSVDINFTLLPGGLLTAVLQANGVSAGTYGSSTMIPVVTVDSTGRITSITQVAASGGGSAAWGSIGAGTGVGSQADLVAYLAANYYPLSSNPAGYITSAALSPYLTIVSAAATYVPLTRTITINGTTFDLSADRSWTISSSVNWGSIGGTLSAQTDLISYLAATYYPLSNPSGYITSAALTNYVQNTRAVNTQHSLTGGGDLSTDRTLSLVNDVASPGANKIYGTDNSGTRNWLTQQSVRGLPISMYIQETYLGSTGTRNVEYVPSLGKLYIANNAAGTVIIINTTTGQQLGVVTAAGANKLKYISSTNEIYVTSTSTASIFRIDGTSNSLNTTITVSITANGYDILEISSTKVYISVAAGTGRIMVINPSISTALAWVTDITLNVPAFPTGMVWNQNSSSSQNGSVIVAANSGFFIVNPATNSVSTTLANPSSAINGGRDCVYSPTLDKYFIASNGSNAISCFSIATSTTLTLDSTIYQAYNVISLGIDETIGYLFACVVINASAGSGGIGIKAFPYGSVVPNITCLTGLVGGGSSVAGALTMDTLNKRIFTIGYSAGIIGQAVALKYII